MFKYHCLNPIAKVGLDGFTEEYVKTEDIGEADGILVRSASMHDMDLPDNLLAVARAGASSTMVQVIVLAADMTGPLTLGAIARRRSHDGDRRHAGDGSGAKDRRHPTG